ncbi:glucosamine-6-phosphate deaminase [Aquimarina sp. AD1]|uniref:glucosamine-6-phosphate deaminase n=1 Tax=Aquimarina sp. (strain AD1) TaxID=1714848 RepID=UPI000E50BDC9|nr:glucosamine-6-phosphate deaminase [Aquimarina sp. AD1]AXT57910.1 glucosamine-6-phosphate deaminase [Aquimarina sp. AD1]RKN28996.1 glucosamine-6-phosphate deaminase [Aquimarina sp. AD1]
MIKEIKFRQVGKFEDTKFEKIHNEIFQDSSYASKLAALEISDLIKQKQKEGKSCVLGLATGSSPIKVYEELVTLYRLGELSFNNVITFNLDEYYPMDTDNQQSYYHFMHQHLFDHVDINPENINIPSGNINLEEIDQYCIDYEMKIKKLGGLDFQLLGIGRTGHIGFNEPGSHRNSGTRIITLDHITRRDAASDFNGLENVPKRAITMGISTIIKAKRILLLAWGHKKASVVKKTIEGEMTPQIPASFLQDHKNITVILDSEAAADLTRIKTPWLVDQCIWTSKLKLKAVTWLSEEVQKPLLKLTDKDYNDHGMSSLLTLEGSAYELNIKMFNHLQNTITGWPGGKPNADDAKRPERANPAQKRVLIFSPHPDDDVISMGGTFSRLIDQGHDVHVAYQTSGNIAVTDQEALKFGEVAQRLADGNSIFKNIIDAIKSKNTGDIDSPEVRLTKGLIRTMESYGATRYLGLPDHKVHFLNLPFYETGRAKKNPIDTPDINIVKDIITHIKPHQIYAAGDLADPHGTHKLCLDAILETISIIKHEKFMNDCWLWLYRGAWHEWDIHDIEMAVPLSPDEVNRKTNAILFHQSQKDKVMFQGEDSREFWLRAEERNKDTAERYDNLGLADYEAIEAFKRHYF